MCTRWTQFRLSNDPSCSPHLQVRVDKEEREKKKNENVKIRVISMLKWGEITEKSSTQKDQDNHKNTTKQQNK